MQIVEFMRARLDELAPEVRQYHEARCPADARCGCGLPQWLAADIAAKRKIVEECAYWRDRVEASADTGSAGSDYGADQYTVAAPILRHLASVYSDHPDYDEGWRS